MQVAALKKHKDLALFFSVICSLFFFSFSDFVLLDQSELTRFVLNLMPKKMPLFQSLSTRDAASFAYVSIVSLAYMFASVLVIFINIFQVGHVRGKLLFLLISWVYSFSSQHLALAQYIADWNVSVSIFMWGVINCILSFAALSVSKEADKAHNS
jgi:hypothetical protein